jgi:acyl-CoA synthetase (NDP forming)
LCMNIPTKTSFMDKFFNPSSVAVIGASNADFNLGATICKTLKEDISYSGPVYTVNRRGETVHGCRGYASVRDIPDDVDLAVVITPAAVVPRIVRECADKGIRSVVIESAGFSEQGVDGERLQREIDEIIKESGMRIMGPNCLGVFDSRSRFCCFYGANPLIPDAMKRPGDVSYIIQSGGVGGLILGSLMEDLPGVNKMVCIGNKSDVDEADILEYFGGDHTRVIGLYLENIIRGERLMHAAGKIAKPILVFKTGRSVEGAAAAVSHTAGIANNDAVFEAACRQSGMIRLETINELYSLPKIFTEMPLLSGNRVAVFTNSGAFGTVAADLIAGSTLCMAHLAPGTREKLRMLNGVFNVHNPVDIGPARKQVYLDIYEILMKADEVDGMLHTVGMWRDFVIDSMGELVQICRQYDKPAAIYPFNARSRIMSVRMESLLPLFDSAEEAVRALEVSHEQFKFQRKKENPSWTRS